MTTPRHRWGEPVRFSHKSERTCIHCGMTKVTRHEGNRHWLEFWKGLEKIGAESTPPCERERIAA